MMDWHWEYAIGILVWLNMLTWLVVGVLRDKKKPPAGEG